VDEAFATWESDAAPAAAPAYGARLATGYEHDFQRITIGGELEAGVYDAFGTPRWGVSLVPSIAGLGGALEAEFAYGLDVLYGRVTGSYGVLGIVPEATLYYSEPGEYTLAYTPVPESVLSLAKRDGGVAGELGLSADLGMFVPVPITMEGGVDLYFENGLERAWDYTLAVTPILGLTAVGSLSGDSVAGNWSSNINWSAGLEYAYGIATITGRIFQEWSALQQERRIGWSIETAVAF
jgi:hypothetical protein